MALASCETIIYSQKLPGLETAFKLRDRTKMVRDQNRDRYERPETKTRPQKIGLELAVVEFIPQSNTHAKV